MDYEAGNLRIEVETNSFYVSEKKRFSAYASMIGNDKRECFDFAYGMSYGKEGEHRDSRSGGTMHRTSGQIFINTFQGKMAEYALYRYLLSKNIELEKPDVSKYELGIWDSFDLTCQGKKLSIKSTKSYGDLLLLETKDWNENGEYIPNSDSGSSKYDYTVLVRFSPDGEQIMKDNKLLYQRGTDISINIKEMLIEKVLNIDWKYDFPGFIYYSELVKMIRDKHILPQGALLNGKMKMDAENYYFQTGKMHPISDLYSYRQNDKEHSSSILRRKCPMCGNELRIRQGPYSTFWGCTGYTTNGCRYKEHIN